MTPSTYGTDNSLVLDALRENSGTARGVVVVNSTVSDQALKGMHDIGLRGIRLNLTLGGARLNELELMADQIAELGWHIQIVTNGEDLKELEPRLTRLCTPLVIDHMGYMPQREGIASEAFKTLQRLLETGRTWVKLSAPYIKSTVGAPDYDDVGNVARELVKLYPARMLWGSDWPHPMAKGQKPDAVDILRLLRGWAPEQSAWKQILKENPVSLYGF